MSLTAAHRQRAYDLLLGAAGTSPFALEAGRFHRAPDPVDRVAVTAAERPVQVVIGRARPINGFNNPLDGRDLSTYALTVRVAYILTGQGEQWDTSGEQSGGADEDSIEDRAATDCKAILDCLGWQPHWTGLDPVVIDCAPSAEQPEATVLGDRYVYEVRFDLHTRASLPDSAHAPAQP